ncbi:MAG TPA: hypothetical protein VIH88_13305 [Candidatus Acidoferrales bacterium]
MSAAIHTTAVSGAAGRRGAAMKAAATTSAAVEPTATTSADVEAAASATTTVTATTTLCECSRRAKQRHRSDCREENLKISGPVHGCYLHPTTSQAARAAGTPRPFYIN